MTHSFPLDAESVRLQQDLDRTLNWKRWGPYLAERQWGTVREDYSAFGECWSYFPHDHARSRAYRWGEDGLLGWTDRECRLCFAVALWNGKDPLLKERLFGLTNNEGNHGEDVKEAYYYLDGTPTHAYQKSLYKYPQAAFPYQRLLDENRNRGRDLPEFELVDTGVFDEQRYWDVQIEYAKHSPDDTLIRLTISNRGPEAATLHVLPTIWFRNTWSWGRDHDEYAGHPTGRQVAPAVVGLEHPTLGAFQFAAGPAPDGQLPPLLFTENETDHERIFGAANGTPYVKDAFHAYLLQNKITAVNPKQTGTKAAGHYELTVAAGKSVTIECRLFPAEAAPAEPFGSEFAAIFQRRLAEADEFYQHRIPAKLNAEQRRVARQAYAGLLWSKQFYHYVVKDWLEGDPSQPAPPAGRKYGRNSSWGHVFNRDVICMPDKWEYPWFAAWDLAFHAVTLATIDPELAKAQLMLMLREWYMHPNGQIPAYEFAFSDVNPPVHAWAVWRVYKMTGPRGNRDRRFLKRAFHKLIINFTWWVNRKDVDDKNVFSGGFLGLDNIGLFDRSKPLPGGGQVQQADGTAWMASFCLTLMAMALELADDDPAYEDVASKFFEHFVAIADAMNTLGGSGLWDEVDGFYYDHWILNGQSEPTRIRSMVGLISLCAVEVLDDHLLHRLPHFHKRLKWFLDHRPDLARTITYMEADHSPGLGMRLLAIPSHDRLVRLLERILDEEEFLSPYGIRSMSRYHRDHPYVRVCGDEEHRVEYVPAESATPLFGGNSNWRGPIWFPLNYLIVEALQRYHHFYGEELLMEYPTGSGQKVCLAEVARNLATRLTRLFLADETGRRPFDGPESRLHNDPHWSELLLFHEFFDGDNGRGLGACHQTGWTALVTRLLEDELKVCRLHPAPKK